MLPSFSLTVTDENVNTDKKNIWSTHIHKGAQGLLQFVELWKQHLRFKKRALVWETVPVFYWEVCKKYLSRRHWTNWIFLIACKMFFSLHIICTFLNESAFSRPHKGFFQQETTNYLTCKLVDHIKITFIDFDSKHMTITWTSLVRTSTRPRACSFQSCRCKSLVLLSNIEINCSSIDSVCFFLFFFPTG